MVVVQDGSSGCLARSIPYVCIVDVYIVYAPINNNGNSNTTQRRRRRYNVGCDGGGGGSIAKSPKKNCSSTRPRRRWRLGTGAIHGWRWKQDGKKERKKIKITTCCANPRRPGAYFTRPHNSLCVYIIRTVCASCSSSDCCCYFLPPRVTRVSRELPDFTHTTMITVC